jgi:hypothetical protein
MRFDIITTGPDADGFFTATIAAMGNRVAVKHRRCPVRARRAALAEAFGVLDLETDPDGVLYALPCTYGHARDEHVGCVCECDLCGCKAFVKGVGT